MLVSRSASSVHTAGTLLGYVRSGNDPRCRRRFTRASARSRRICRSLYDERAQNKSNRDGQRTFAVTEREAREAIALTYGMITMVDDAIGSILGWLKTLRLDEDTVVVFTSDHGDFMGDHQLLLKGALHYRGLVRVPFIWNDPSADSRGAGQSRAFAAPSISPIRFSIAPALQGHNGMQGSSLLPAIRGEKPATIRLLIEEHQRRGYMGLKNNFRARSLITEDSRLTLYEGVDWGELYDFSQRSARNEQSVGRSAIARPTLRADRKTSAENDGARRFESAWRRTTDLDEVTALAGLIYRARTLRLAFRLLVLRRDQVLLRLLPPTRSAPASAVSTTSPLVYFSNSARMALANFLQHRRLLRAQQSRRAHRAVLHRVEQAVARRQAPDLRNLCHARRLETGGDQSARCIPPASL